MAGQKSSRKVPPHLALYCHHLLEMRRHDVDSWLTVAGRSSVGRYEVRRFCVCDATEFDKRYFNWWVLFTAIFLAIGFSIIIQLIPTMLNLSRSFFTFLASLS